MIVFQGDAEIVWPLGIETDQTFGRLEHKRDDGIVKLAADPNGNAGEKRGLIWMLRKRDNGKSENKNAWIRIL